MRNVQAASAAGAMRPITLRSKWSTAAMAPKNSSMNRAARARSWSVTGSTDTTSPFSWTE